MLTVSEITKSYGGKTLFDDVTTSFEPGHRYGLTGANGAKLARTPPEQGAKPSKPVKAAARAMAFTTPAAQVGELLVHFTGAYRSRARRC